MHEDVKQSGRGAFFAGLAHLGPHSKRPRVNDCRLENLPAGPHTPGDGVGAVQRHVEALVAPRIDGVVREGRKARQGGQEALKDKRRHPRLDVRLLKTASRGALYSARRPKSPVCKALRLTRCRQARPSQSAGR